MKLTDCFSAVEGISKLEDLGLLRMKLILARQRAGFCGRRTRRSVRRFPRVDFLHREEGKQAKIE